MSRPTGRYVDLGVITCGGDWDFFAALAQMPARLSQVRRTSMACKAREDVVSARLVRRVVS